MKELMKRLEKLEANGNSIQHSEPDSSGALRIQTTILAVHRGNYQEGEAVAEAYARALHYDKLHYFKTAIARGDSDWLERHNAVWADVCQEYGLHGDLPQSEVIRIVADLLEQAPHHALQYLYQEGASRP